MAAWPAPIARLLRQSSVSCPPTLIPVGVLVCPQPSLPSTWQDLVSLQKWKADRKMCQIRETEKGNICLCSLSTLHCFIHIYCDPNYTWKEEHSVLTAANVSMPSLIEYTHTKDKGNKHTVAMCKVFQWNATLLYVLYQNSGDKNDKGRPAGFSSAFSSIFHPLCHFLCAPFSSFCILVIISVTYHPLASLFFTCHFFLHPLICPSLLPSLFQPHNLSLFSHLIPWAHSVKTKIH